MLFAEDPPTHHYTAKTDRASPNDTRIYSLFSRITEIKMLSPTGLNLVAHRLHVIIQNLSLDRVDKESRDGNSVMKSEIIPLSFLLEIVIFSKETCPKLWQLGQNLLKLMLISQRSRRTF
jgi:hypothetical protein